MPYSSAKTNRHHNKAMHESKRAFCCTTVASRTQPISKLTHQLLSNTSVTCSFLIHILPQAGHVPTFFSPKMLQMKPTGSSWDTWLWQKNFCFLCPSVSFPRIMVVVVEKQFCSISFVLLHLLRNSESEYGFRSWYEIHLYLSQEYWWFRPHFYTAPTPLPAGQSAYIYFPYSPSEIHTYFLTPLCPSWELPWNLSQLWLRMYLCDSSAQGFQLMSEMHRQLDNDGFPSGISKKQSCSFLNSVRELVLGTGAAPDACDSKRSKPSVVREQRQSSQHHNNK